MTVSPIRATTTQFMTVARRVSRRKWRTSSDSARTASASWGSGAGSGSTGELGALGALVSGRSASQMSMLATIEVSSTAQHTVSYLQKIKIMSQYVLYTNHSYTDARELCPGSKACLEHVQGHANVAVEDVAELLAEGVELPPWLDATPTLVDTATSAASQGEAAVRQCAAIAEATRAEPALSVSEPTAETRAKVKDSDVERLQADRKRLDDALSSAMPSETLPPPLQERVA